jgi:GTP-binding protein HflX
MPRARISLTTKPQTQKAFLVGADLRRFAYKNDSMRLPLQSSMAELTLLCQTAGLDVIGQMTQVLDAPNPNTFIGPGKVEELITWRDSLEFDVVVFDDELSPRHQRELEELLGPKVTLIDRTALILDIFAQHASTREGALQVELAQYEYRKPRLTRMWTHLARQAGGGSGRSGNGGVGLRGPGETQLEIDRRAIDQRITKLKHDLEAVRAQRAMQRKQRKKNETPVVAIVGYTNAGKSTLLNSLARAEVLTEDKLFASLDPTTRRVRLPHGHAVLFTDTVGFIQKLPTQLIAAFRATLEEITEADALLHVVDATHPNAAEQAQTVIDTLTELGAGGKQMIFALNKADKLDDDARDAVARGLLSEGVFISAQKKTGLNDLLAVIEDVLFERMVTVKVRLPYKAGDLMALIRREGSVDSEIPEERSILITGRIPGRLIDAFAPYRATADRRQSTADGRLLTDD